MSNVEVDMLYHTLDALWTALYRPIGLSSVQRVKVIAYTYNLIAVVVSACSAQYSAHPVT